MNKTTKKFMRDISRISRVHPIKVFTLDEVRRLPGDVLATAKGGGGYVTGYFALDLDGIKCG